MKIESRVMCRTHIGATLGMLVFVTVLVGPAPVCAADVSSDKKVLANSAPCGVGTCTLCCPDDYVRKPAPGVSPVPCCRADTYCPKASLVLPSPTKSCCPDDYRFKPRPTLCSPANAWYKCVPAISCPRLPPPTYSPAAKHQPEARR